MSTEESILYDAKNSEAIARKKAEGTYEEPDDEIEMTPEKQEWHTKKLIREWEFIKKTRGY